MKYVALLRGINVGGNNTVPMSELKELFEHLGFTAVVTYINSGNVICDGNQALIKKVEPAFTEHFGFSITFLFVKAAAFEKICAAIPTQWENNAEYKTDVWFLWDAYDTKQSLQLLSITPGVDEVMYIDGAIVWHLPKKSYTKSGMHDVIGSQLYKHLTARNVNTVRKLTNLLKE